MENPADQPDDSPDASSSSSSAASSAEDPYSPLAQPESKGPGTLGGFY